MKTNIKKETPVSFTHAGSVAKNISPLEELKRTLMACMLWENNFYESGKSVATRITDLVAKVDPQACAKLAIEARTNMKLRHAPLLVVRAMAALPRHKAVVAELLPKVIQRADELSEFLSLYWKEGRCPIAKCVKKGLGDAFKKFDEYALGKYNRDAAIKLRDVLFMTHPKPKSMEQADLWKRLVDGKLQTPDTWEVELSASSDKKTSWTRLLKENKLGALALLRNLRNITSVISDRNIIRNAITEMDPMRVLPFRFISAVKYAPQFSDELEQKMLSSIQGMNKLPGTTVILVDVSGSMDAPVSSKSDITRLDAASGVAVIARELCEDAIIKTFSERTVDVANTRGFSLIKSISQSQPHSGTYLGKSLSNVNFSNVDRLIVITDEQSADRVTCPKVKNAYMINVASNQNGVGYHGGWKHIDGWSEAVVGYISAMEQSAL